VFNKAAFVGKKIFDLIKMHGTTIKIKNLREVELVSQHQMLRVTGLGHVCGEVSLLVVCEMFVYVIHHHAEVEHLYTIIRKHRYRKPVVTNWY
jgi:hypothetical protein